MSASPVKRKLAAILAADAVGYSRLMAADEEGTMKILSAHRAVMDGIIQFHEGRIVNTAGDSVLAEFASPIEAVRCAVEIQDALKTRNDALLEAQRMQFRIGVNLGDVMVKGEDLLGDGVNVAARLQGIAEPGNICLSSSVYDQIAGKLDLGFADLGDQSLKNIDRPIHAYRVEREGRRVSPVPRPRKGAPGAGARAGLAAGAIVLAAAVVWYMDLIPLRQPPAPPAAPAPAVDERAKAEAELARARAETEAARRKVEDELAAAEKARRAAEAAATTAAKPPPAAPAPAPAPVPVPATRWQGPWMANFSCPPFRAAPAQSWAVPFSVSADLFELQFRERDQPGSFHLRGAPQPDGRLQLLGGGVSGLKDSYGASYFAAFDLKPEGERLAGSGRLGARDCTLSLARR